MLCTNVWIIAENVKWHMFLTASFGRSLASYIDDVCDNRTPLFIARQNARCGVLMSEEDYEGLVETVHLLKSPANATRLLRSIKDVGQDN